MSLVLSPELDSINRQARPYPAHQLDGCQTGLVLFAAAFLGHNDAIHFARQRIRTVCIDIDDRRLEEMSRIYPSSWTFLNHDAWWFAEGSREMGSRYDAVSVDTFTGEATQRSLQSLELWTSIANRIVTCTITKDDPVPPDVPEGWAWHLFPRSSDVHWLVLTKC